MSKLPVVHQASPVQTGMKDCPNCGRKYFNWCTYCQAQKEIEDIPHMMDRYGLDTDNLVAELAVQIGQNSFPALNLAFNLRGINVTKRIEFEGKITADREGMLTEEELDARIEELLKKEEKGE